MTHIPEIAADIQFQDISITLVISAAGTDKLIYPFYHVQGSFSFAAAIGIMDQFTFNYMIHTPVQQMMHHPVSKIGGKYFPLNGFIDDKCNTGLRDITALLNFFGKL